MAKKITCPVCLTVMRPVGEDLVCPVCGYKYCANREPYIYDDHNHSQYESYNTKTSYTSAHHTDSSAGPSASRNVPAAPARPRPNTSFGKPAKKNPNALTVFIIIAITLLLTFFDNRKDLYDLFHSDPPAPQHSEEAVPVETFDYLSDLDLSGGRTYTLDPGQRQGTLLQDFVYAAFGAPLSLVSSEDLMRVKLLYIYPDEDTNELNVEYRLDSAYDSPTEFFYSEKTFCDLSELQLFTELEILSCDETAPLSPGDLDGLHSLSFLYCCNSPEELISIIDPVQLYLLSINMESFSMSGIEHFNELSCLYLSGSQIQDLERISVLSQLDEFSLRLWDTEEKVNVSFLDSLTQLTYLDLVCNLSDLSFLNHMEGVSELLLGNMDSLTDISPLQNLSLLTDLTIYGCPNIENIHLLGNMHQLELLDLRLCNLNQIDWAASLENLYFLDISYNNIESLSPLNSLEMLTQFYYDHNPISDYGCFDPPEESDAPNHF